MNSIKQIGLGIFVLVVVFSMISQCGEKQAARSAQSSEIILREYAKGLDLAAVTALAKKAKDAAEFERLLNSSSEGVNNLDLNDDDKVDYIKVSEYGSGDHRGFSLTTEIAPGKTQEVATIEFQKSPDGATVQTTGNSSLYGPNHYHHSSFGVGDALLMAWLFSNRQPYASPYGYGNYPPGYGGGWQRRPTDSYTSTMTSRGAGTTVRPSAQPVISKPLASPNAQQMAAKAKVLTSPTKSQRTFGSRPSSAPTRSGGFGRSSYSGSSRSGGSFGGGK